MENTNVIKIKPEKIFIEKSKQNFYSGVIYLIDRV